MAKDALGEVFTEKRDGRVVQVRRITVTEAVVPDLLAEVNAAMKLSSPAILRPLDAKAEGGRVTVLSETFDGCRTLRGLLTTLASTGEKLPVSTATWITIKVLEALEHAQSRLEAGHPAPVFHGRLSPEHVMLTPSGDVRVTGFGLAAAARNVIKPQQKTDPAFAYVAPEQLTGGELTSASDNFALAAVLAEALLGKPIFLEDTFAQTFEAIQSRLPPLIRETRDNVPKALDEAIAWALEKNPARRAPRPEALRNRLEAFQGMLAVGDRIKSDEHPKRIADLIRLRKAPPAGLDVTSIEPAKARARGPAKRRPVLAALRFTFLLSLVGLGAGVWEKWRDLEEPIRARIPPQVATVLGIDPVAPLPVVPVDAGPAADAGLAVAAAEPVDAGVAPTPKPGVLSIVSTPKAAVVLDGKSVGTTPLSGLSVEAGEHTVVFTSKKPKLEVSQTVTVAEGETKKLVVKLKRK